MFKITLLIKITNKKDLNIFFFMTIVIFFN